MNIVFRSNTFEILFKVILLQSFGDLITVVASVITAFSTAAVLVDRTTKERMVEGFIKVIH